MNRVAPPSPASDGEIARGIASGDAEAEAALYERFAGRVHCVARRELRSADLADDARSETFVRVLEALRQKRLRSEEALAGFVLQTARHVVYEMMRKRTRDAAIAADVDASDLEAPPPLAPEVAQAVRGILRELSPRDRTFIRLYYYDELPKDEIATRLGIAPARLRLVKSRSLQRFRRALEAEARR